MRAWEGYSKRNLDYFLGPKGQRSLMIKELTQKFQAAYGPSWNFTDEQIKILQNIDSSFTVLDCIAGAGKTTMLVALALWMLHNKRLGFGGCLHYMTETQEMVNEFIARVQHIHQSSEGITAIGYDRVTEGVDVTWPKLEALVDALIQDAPRVENISIAVGLLLETMPRNSP